MKTKRTNMFCVRVLALAAVLILIAILTVGCGGSGDETPETTTAAQSEATTAMPESTTISQVTTEASTEPPSEPPTTTPSEPSAATRGPTDELPVDERIGLELIATGFLNDITEGSFEKCIGLFDDALSAELPEDELIRAWSSVIVRAGDFVYIARTEYAFKDGLDIIRIVSRHLSGGVSSTIAFSLDGEISGLSFDTMDSDDIPEGGLIDPGLLEATLPGSVIEENVVIGEGSEYPLRGKLTLPREAGAEAGAGAGGYPAVVLVHGSGALDMDVSIGPNKIFRDIAWALSEKGIAVLRYDKRTFIYSGTLEDEYGAALTVREEQIEDAILAKELLVSDDRINSDAILVAGHDMGGMIAPRILDEGGFAGALILAGSPRSFVEITIDQTEYLISIGYFTEEEAGIQRSINESQLEAYKDLANEDDEYAMETIIFGINGFFLKEMEQHETSGYFDRIDKPILIMHGVKDFQFSYEKDFGAYRELAGNRENIELKAYDGLNHLFIESAMETPDLSEYQTPGFVDSQATEDIANWIIENFTK